MTEPVMRPNHGVAWVTGASSGIGRAVCLRLAKEGWRVAASARRADALEELAREAGALKGEVQAFPVDITDQNAVHACVAEIERSYGPIALALLNAGVYLPVDAAKFKAEALVKSVNVNLFGAAFALEAITPAMVERGRGHIAIVSSVTGYGGLPTSSAYGATKAALINMAECFKIELDRWGVRTSVINPGFVETPAQDDNTFPKPFMVSADTAAKRIVRGLKTQAFEITFPKRFTYQLKLLGLLPARTRLNLVKKQTGWAKKPADGGMAGPE